jgi:two-component system sensor histidine kinase/response regulator
MLELYREILGGADHEVSIAENGIQALARTDGQGKQPELIVCDLMMPNLNGYMFMQQLRLVDAHRATPVIAASSLSTGEWALRSGADRFVAKPFRSHELTALIAELLGRGSSAA